MLVQIIASFAVAAGSAAAVYQLFRFLSNFQPLTNAALDWLTNPRSDAFLVLQYMAIRTRLFGSRIWCFRRAVAVAIPFAVVLLVLGAVHLLPMAEEERTLQFLLYAATKIFAFHYFRIWQIMPLHAFGILAAAFAIAMLSFAAFDRMTRTLLLIVKSLPLYLLALLVTLAAIYVLLLFLAGFPVSIFLASTEANACTIFMAGLSIWPNLLTEFSRATATDDALRWAIVFAEAIAIVGTATSLFAAILMSITLNLLYATALIAARLEIFLRLRLRWRQSRIFESPIEYLGHIASAIAFVVTLAACALWFVAARSLNFE